jgi:SAM-dependent methyltransferase
MPRTEPFDQLAGDYDDWFDRNEHAYRSELDAVRTLLPRWSRGVEVGVGTGRFAAPLGIELGVEPSTAMAELARARGVRVVEGVAEHLPLDDSAFDFVLMVTTVCFLDDVAKALDEARRVLEDEGHLLIGFLDRDTEMGRAYDERKSESPFYKHADFRSATELLGDLRHAGFDDLTWMQTLFDRPSDMREPSPVRPGYGTGLFVVVRARKPATETDAEARTAV